MMKLRIGSSCQSSTEVMNLKVEICPKQECIVYWLVNTSDQADVKRIAVRR